MVVNHNGGSRGESVSKARAVTSKSVNYSVTISRFQGPKMPIFVENVTILPGTDDTDDTDNNNSSWYRYKLQAFLRISAVKVRL